MGKTVYSLVLDDEIIAEVDRMAYHTGTNRSGMINQILADYFSFTTPEKRIRAAFEEVEKWVDTVSGFRMQAATSESMLSLQSALAFKYNPSIRYTVELYREQGAQAGELRVGFRTQNRQLIEGFQNFLLIWARLEEVYIGKFFPELSVPYAIENGRYRRWFRTPDSGSDSRQLGQAVAQYIRMFDTVLKVYFARIGLPDAMIATQDAYRECLQSMECII